MELVRDIARQLGIALSDDVLASADPSVIAREIARQIDIILAPFYEVA